MATRLIKLEDGILVEAEVPDNEAKPISTNVVKDVKSSFAQVKPILVSISRPIAEAWQEINKEMEIEQAEVEVGFNFEGEGNLYITKGKPDANLKVKLVLKPIAPKPFDVITVNSKGEEINRSSHEAVFFTEDLGKGVTLEMVSIPGGSFVMGSAENEVETDSPEGPQHEVTIQPFYISKYPITQDQYQAIMGKNPSHFKGGKRPVETVTWHNATTFCQNLSKKIGKTYKLPSESQWEYACRAGTTTPFYFGETITTDLVNYNGNYTYGDAPKGEYRGETTDVGSFPPNAFGLYDMHGNVWEWCQDIWHDNYEGAPNDGSAWETGGDSKIRVLRGGYWEDEPGNCRSGFRLWGDAGFCSNNRGFRVVYLPGA
ncbi:MAG: formylglycine-generating enzyme family protein [Okeania sp. SIO1H6]|nr:formylglycine-generating enzyme family protein [Okeania sp. SIO1H6]